MSLAEAEKITPAFWKVKAQVKAEKREFHLSLNLDLELSLVSLASAIIDAPPDTFASPPGR